MRRSNLFRVSFAVLLVTVLSGCVPSNMHVRYGLSPKNVDDDVRFRTTYYFRTFDYCWDANAKYDFRAEQGGVKVGDEIRDYRDIIPQTDTLYRYRMTGKASALFSKIRFESGVLGREQVDPFGSQVTYSSDADGFYIRENAEVKRDAERAEVRSETLARIKDMSALLDSLVPADKQPLLAKIAAAAEAYMAGTSSTPTQLADLAKQIENLKADVAKIDPAIKAEVEATFDKAKAALLSALAAKNELGACPIGQDVRKGFQIMGPEGLKTFRQDERLIMAMSSSAKPLIETLQEYSGRILNGRVDSSGQLIAFARENALVETARRKVADARAGEGTADGIFSAAVADLKVAP